MKIDRSEQPNSLSETSLTAHVYVLWDGIKSYYIGSTFNFDRRFHQHSTGIGAWVTKQWYKEGRISQVYWKLPVGKLITRRQLNQFEALVRTTIWKQNPTCIVN